jgi:hypothetical protein
MRKLFCAVKRHFGLVLAENSLLLRSNFVMLGGKILTDEGI